MSGSRATRISPSPSSFVEYSTTCGSLLHELQRIWDEIGESDGERDKMLLQLEQECLDVYRRKVESAKKYKTDLRKTLDEAEEEVANIASALGEKSLILKLEKRKGTLKEQLLSIKPILEEFQHKREERMKEFCEIQSQIIQLCSEITGEAVTDKQIDNRDLTAKRLGEIKLDLQGLQREKNLRLQKISSHVRSIYELSDVLSADFSETMNEIHPSLCSSSTNSQLKSISNVTISRLDQAVNSLKHEKEQRLRKLQDLGSTLIELWNLLDTPADERKRFDHVTTLISAPVNEVTKRGSLALDIIEQTEVEIDKLNILKASKMKELVLEKQKDLEEIYKSIHIDVDTQTTRQILATYLESGDADISDLLSNVDDQILKAKELALSRKEILDKVEKWKLASVEESWLDEYEKDQNRYSAGRGVHKNLKRAEKARILVGKLPSLVENLMMKIKAWEEEKGIVFLYDKMPLLDLLQQYAVYRLEREEEKKRSREKKRLQDQLATEQETLFGSKPSPMRAQTLKKPLGQSNNSNSMIGTPTGRNVFTPRQGKDRKVSNKASAVAAAPVNYVALAKDDCVAHIDPAVSSP
ncbi:hypothetical protein Scep_003165 [Stephania cephalantha]|uniref:65-kDa microtubule-associated protein 5 n=1 Tax=Stephania cephalantha TaxID=152367 RepID=A0AAP0KQ02_9MAGN